MCASLVDALRLRKTAGLDLKHVQYAQDSSAMPRGWLTIVALSLTLALSRPGHAAGPRVHTVYRGQNLGAIASRYNVTVAAIAYANDLANPRLIRPGTKLVIPDRHDDGGREARKLFEQRYRRSATVQPKSSKRSRSPARPPVVHVVAKGQRLASIARRYRVSVDAIAVANGLEDPGLIRPGLLLVIPPPGTDAASIRQERAGLIAAYEKRRSDKKQNGEPSWRAYAKAPGRRGYVKLVGYQRQWQGYGVGANGRVLGAAHRAATRMLNGQSLERGISRRLIALMVRVSDQFGGRPLHVVSGFRSKSYSQESRHRHGRAVDFFVPGVPNSALRDYLLTFPRVGVGYYPNSTFVHLDVREQKTYWVDVSRPGQPPRYASIVHLSEEG
jgi:LysM repeat protein